MIDKQIIIDNVDVSECGGYYFSPTGFHSCQDIQQVNNLGYEQDTLCEQNPNCNYKQLKRKEQECTRLKGLCNGLDTTIDNYTNLIELRNQQLDQLKTENDTYKKMLEDGDFILALTEIRTGERHLWYNKAQKLEKTLTEIKEIAENCYDPADKENDGFWTILQKISEVQQWLTA